VSARAELLDDAGAASESEEFFRSGAFLDAEGVTHTLRVETREGSIAVPVIVREIPGGGRDAVSPYGYPGATVTGHARPSPADVAWSETGLVSVFLRDRAGGEPAFAGATERSLLQVSDPREQRKSRMSDRQQIRRNEREGYVIERIDGPDAGANEHAAYAAAYDQTMARANASERYLYGPEYWEKLLRSPRSWLFVARAPDGGAAAGAIAALSDGIVHYYLSGTVDAHLSASPAKNLIAAVIDFAEELGVPMNLGGGVTPGDSLEAFKKGFSNAVLPFHTHEIVCDPDAYRDLAGDREDTGFFPLYRAPSAAWRTPRT
jgi:Acetyltransferase (GNAT) domain